MSTEKDDGARRAVKAFFAGRKYNDRLFYTKDTNHGFELGTHSGGWLIRCKDGRYVMWVERYVKYDYYLHHALKDLYGIEIPTHRNEPVEDLLGPLGLAALRASLDLTPTTTTVVEEGTTR